MNLFIYIFTQCCRGNKERLLLHIYLHLCCTRRELLAFSCSPLAVLYRSALRGKNQENIYILYASNFLKNKINSAAVKMCRLIQFLYSGFVVKVGV